MYTEKYKWLTVKQAGNLLGITERGIRKGIKAKKYTTKTVTGNGGQQYRILLSSLPQSAQDLYFADKTKELVVENTLVDVAAVAEQEQQKAAERMKIRQQGLMDFSALPKAKQQQAKQKQQLVHACQQYIRENALKKVTGVQEFCNKLNAGGAGATPKGDGRHPYGV